MGKGLCINPGELKNLITIQVLTEGRTANGGFSHSWATFETAWAKIDVISGKEFEQGDKQRGETIFIFTFRHIDDVLKTHRISWDSRIFNIVEVKNVQERNIVNVVRAVEVDA